MTSLSDDVEFCVIGYDVFSEENEYETTIVVLARSDNVVYFKNWTKPLSWPRANRMRVLTRAEFNWLCETELWRRVKLTKRTPVYIIQAATREWFLALGTRPRWGRK